MRACEDDAQQASCQARFALDVVFIFKLTLIGRLLGYAAFAYGYSAANPTYNTVQIFLG